MKKLLKLLLSLTLVISMCACSSGDNETKETKEDVVEKSAEEQLEEDKNELSGVGDIEVEEGILYVYITLPAEFVEEGITQDDLDKDPDANYTKATLNEDGSVTFKLTKKQYKEMLNEVKESFDETLNEMVQSEEYAFTEIKHNDDFTEFNCTIDGEELGLAESFSAIIFYFCGGMYQVYTGTESPIVVNFYSSSGELIESYDTSNVAE